MYLLDDEVYHNGSETNEITENSEEHNSIILLDLMVYLFSSVLK